ncbi:hypothetical protein ACFQ0M_48775 [Kitasatospora aburaviensis]|uniref:HNH endonuclease n=1 Tax=Kitasatospora aburaviensis TaxID=67265 RepID=A0ABW1F4B2_9ACTN
MEHLESTAERDGEDRPEYGENARPAVPWADLVADSGIVGRYWEKVHRRGPQGCWYWLASISDSGHGKLRCGSRTDGSRRVVNAHQLGWAIHHGPDSLLDGRVVRHTCDEGSCQNPGHWRRGERLENVADFLARRELAGHPLGDARGPHGRAVAIRDAIKKALAEGGDVEAAIAEAIAAGNASKGHQETLW